MIIRKAKPNDAVAIATCILYAMEEIVYKFIGSRDEATGRAFILHFVKATNNQYSYQNAWVAEIDGEVMGAAIVYDGAQLHPLRQPVIDYIKNHFHHNFVPEDETEAGEYYIDTIGVVSNARGKGIGSGLLQFLIDEYVNKGRKTLGLLVDEDNPNAKKLYLKIGFKMRDRKYLFGKSMEHLQMKPKH